MSTETIINTAPSADAELDPESDARSVSADDRLDPDSGARRLANGGLDPGPIARPRKQKYRGSRPRFPTKPHPLTREQLDSRTAAAKTWDNLCRNIINEAGGESEVSAIKRELIDAFAGMAVHFQDLNIKSLLGQPIKLVDLSMAASTMTRLASRIGVERIARDVTPTPDAYLKKLRAEAAKAEEVEIEEADVAEEAA